MYNPHPESERLRRIFEDTQVLRKPIAGIVTGYHVLPYVLVGPDEEHSARSVEIRGKIRVSPRMILTPRHLGQTYEQLFDDPPVLFFAGAQGFFRPLALADVLDAALYPHQAARFIPDALSIHKDIDI